MTLQEMSRLSLWEGRFFYAGPLGIWVVAKDLEP